ncbi:hypothetical protein EBR96_01065 [bacterium]|nr:hypothetical protein [bacterium]
MKPNTLIQTPRWTTDFSSQLALNSTALTTTFMFPQKSEARNNIPSTNGQITQFLGGGLPKGAISEFGIPLGYSGRCVIADFVSQLTQSGQLCLWVNSHSNLKVYPPAWLARGIDPLKWVVANTTRPLRDLKAALIQPIFQLVVLDATQRNLSTEDIAYIGLQARLHRYAVVIIRPHLLSNQRGNTWAKLRVNIVPHHNRLHLTVIKGLSERQLTVSC